MKIKGLIFFLLLLLAIGAVAASDDVNDTISAPGDNIELENEISKMISVEDNNELEEDGDYSENLTTNTTPMQPQISANTITGNQGKQLILKATVKTENGPLKDATVQFKFNGKTYTAKTNENGVATYTLKFPLSKALKTTSKTKGNILTKTTTYKSTYKCDVTVSGDGLNTSKASFNVISKKASTVKKYKIIKTKKTYTLPVKNGWKGYSKGAYGIATHKYKKGYYNVLETIVLHKNDEKFIKFSTKHHYKMDGKWRWDKWTTCNAGTYDEFGYLKGITCDKIMVKYTQVSYKLIK